MGIKYEINHAIEVEQFVQILADSGLGERRPIDNPDTMSAKQQKTNLKFHIEHHNYWLM